MSHEGESIPGRKQHAHGPRQKELLPGPPHLDGNGTQEFIGRAEVQLRSASFGNHFKMAYSS